jgi:hypothetical protein
VKHKWILYLLATLAFAGGIFFILLTGERQNRARIGGTIAGIFDAIFDRPATRAKPACCGTEGQNLPVDPRNQNGPVVPPDQRAPTMSHAVKRPPVTTQKDLGSGNDPNMVVPVPNPSPEPEPRQGAYAGPSAGTIVWEGTVHGIEFVIIDNGSASRGVLISGKLPGIPVLIQPLNPKKVGIAGMPGPDNNYQRVTLRVQGNGLMRVVLSWSLP